MKKIDFHTLGPLIALIALIVLGTLLNSAFLAPANITNVLARSAFIGLIAVGMTFVITAGGLDLSVGSMAAFLAGLAIIAMNALAPSLGVPWGTILIGMGVDPGRARCRISERRADHQGPDRAVHRHAGHHGHLSLAHHLAGGWWHAVAGFRPAHALPPRLLRRHRLADLADPVLCRRRQWSMRHSRFGRHVEAIGSNDRVARYSAIDVNRVRLMTYVLLGMLVGLAVVLYVPRLGSASGSTGVLWELEAIAAVIIGGTALKGGRGRVWGTVMGVLILSLIDNILNLANLVSPYLNGAIQGVIIVLAVVLQREKHAASER
jgi:ribose transport system permease protein